MAVPFDTLAVARRLEQAGFDTRQAQEASAAFAEAMAAGVATGEDLRELRRETESGLAGVRRDLDALRKEMEGLRKEMDAGFSDLRKDMTSGFAQLEQRMTIRLGAMVVVGVSLLLAAGFLM